MNDGGGGVLVVFRVYKALTTDKSMKGHAPDRRFIAARLIEFSEIIYQTLMTKENIYKV